METTVRLHHQVQQNPILYEHTMWPGVWRQGSFGFPARKKNNEPPFRRSSARGPSTKTYCGDTPIALQQFSKQQINHRDSVSTRATANMMEDCGDRPLSPFYAAQAWGRLRRLKVGKIRRALRRLHAKGSQLR